MTPDLYEDILDPSTESPRLTGDDIEELRAAGMDIHTDPVTGETTIRDVARHTITIVTKNGTVKNDQ